MHLTVINLTSWIDRDHLNALIKTLYVQVDGRCIKVPSTQQPPSTCSTRRLLWAVPLWGLVELLRAHSENERLQSEPSVCSPMNVRLQHSCSDTVAGSTIGCIYTSFIRQNQRVFSLNIAVVKQHAVTLPE